MLLIHAYASQVQYWRHLSPIVDELRARGHEVETWSKRATQPWGGRVRIPPPGDLVLVASEIDARLVAPNGVVYLEHGAGQSYTGRRLNLRGFPGGPDLDHIRLFITPGEHVADLWRAKYPGAAVAVVGCPALDQHLRVAEDHHDHDDDQDEHDHSAADEHAPIVAITGHWRCGLCTETMPATPLFERGIRDLLVAGVPVVGHAHPRDRSLRAMWDRLRVPFEPDPDVILATADLLVADNTSLLPEMAAVGKPVLFLNGPRYRRDVIHGGRFWDWPEGQVSCDDPADLAGAVDLALADPPEVRESRSRMVRSIYAHTDDRSAARAVTAIEQVI